MPTADKVAQVQAQVGTKYRTYKRATDKLAGWLTATAKQVGFRKGGTPIADTIKIAQFVTLTDVIVKAEPKVEIPPEVLAAAETAFHFRLERANLLKGVDLESDERHHYIITAIGAVVEKLRGHAHLSKQATKPPLDAVAVEAKQDGALIPSFQLLKVEPVGSGDEEDGGSSSDTEPEAVVKRHLSKVNKSKKKKLWKQKKKARKEAKQNQAPSEEEDPYFVLMCLLSDLKSMRGYIKEVWKEYKEGKVDLITASLTTNATFDIIRSYEIDIPAVSFLLSDYSKTMRLILPRHLDESDKGLELFFNPPTTLAQCKTGHLVTVGQSLSRISLVAELTFASAFYFLDGPRHLIVERKDGQMQTIIEERDPFGKYQPKQRRQKLSSAQCFLEDIQILAAYAQDVYRCDKFQHFTLDHFTMQWREEYGKSGDKTITLAQAFGAQLYLDIQHILRHDSVRGLQDLFSASLRMSKSRESWRKHTPQGLYKAEEQWRQMEHNIEWTTNVLLVKVAKPILQAVEKVTGSDEINISKARNFLRTSTTVLPFLKLNPLMCGVLLFASVSSIRSAGSQIGSHFDTVQYAGQIYYGCRLQREYWKQKAARDPTFEGSSFEKKLNRGWKDSLVWDDMEFLFELHGVDAFFDGDIPQNNYELVKSMVPSGRLRVGQQYKSKEMKRKGITGPLMSVPKLTKNGSGKIVFAKIVHGFEPIAVTHRLYYSKYMKFIGKKDYVYEWSWESLQALLQTQLDKLGKADGFGQKITLKGADGDVSQVTILRTLKETLHNESRALNFDFLDFFTYTYMILKDIKESSPHILELFVLPRLTSHEGEDLSQAISAIHAAINAPEPGVDLDPFDGSEDDDMFTNAGHILLDKRMYWNIEIIAGFKSKQIQSIDSIWGIKPDPIPKPVTSMDEEVDQLIPKSDAMARTVFRFLSSGLTSELAASNQS